jgi:hypothetical protein
MKRINRKSLSTLAQDLINHVTFGNSKLPKSTMIFNMSPARYCASRELGFCQCPDKCYADKAERMYPSVLPYRTRQSQLWSNNMASAFVEVVRWKNSQGGVQVTKLRYNESGDFRSDYDVFRLDTIAYALQAEGVQTYGYSARKDLDFSTVSFLVRGSGYANKDGESRAVPKASGNHPVCLGDCKKCSLCLTSAPVIECILH